MNPLSGPFFSSHSETPYKKKHLDIFVITLFLSNSKQPRELFTNGGGGGTLLQNRWKNVHFTLTGYHTHSWMCLCYFWHNFSGCCWRCFYEKTPRPCLLFHCKEHWKQILKSEGVFRLQKSFGPNQIHPIWTLCLICTQAAVKWTFLFGPKLVSKNHVTKDLFTDWSGRNEGGKSNKRQKLWASSTLQSLSAQFTYLNFILHWPILSLFITVRLNTFYLLLLYAGGLLQDGYWKEGRLNKCLLFLT